MDCKQILDNLRGLAKRQGQEQWFDSIYHDDAKLVELVAAYAARCPKGPKTGRRKSGGAKFKLAEFRAIHEASVEVLKDDVGKMMDEEDFLKWATTDRMPKLSLAGAKAEWDKNDQNEKRAGV